VIGKVFLGIIFRTTPMSTHCLVSIIIDNYNYGRFLADAIDSALGQTYARVEVIVVDDGSTDESRQVIARYGSRITAVLKENGGQGSAFNAGFQYSHGDVILFLDADDILLPTAVEKAVPLFRGAGVVKVHWPLWLADEQGRSMGVLFPEQPLPEGDLRQSVLHVGPANTGNSGLGAAWSRGFLERIFPIPEGVYRIAADTYLFELAPFFGPLKAVHQPQGLYRQHGKNDHRCTAFEANIEREIKLYDSYCTVLCQHLQRAGIRIDREQWKRESWWHKLRESARDIAALPEPERPLILVDDATWGPPLTVAGRRALPFLEHEGQYAGAPADDVTAIAELERLRRAGAGFVAFAWPATWWLEAYAGFHRHLRASYPCVLESDRLVVFDLRT
jgi:glycosyltransferase involved in cell wall biosynthesis